MLAEAIPGERQVIGIDLAQGMVDVALARIEASSDTTLRWAYNSPNIASAASTVAHLCNKHSLSIMSGFD